MSTKASPAKAQRRKEDAKKYFKLDGAQHLSELSLRLCAFARNFRSFLFQTEPLLEKGII
jgi:hypothetical protein